MPKLVQESTKLIVKSNAAHTASKTTTAITQNEKIASHIKAQLSNMQVPGSTTESITECISCRCGEAASSILDHKTRELLEYQVLLWHPKYKDAWNLSAANEFRWLAQRVGTRYKEQIT